MLVTALVFTVSLGVSAAQGPLGASPASSAAGAAAAPATGGSADFGQLVTQAQGWLADLVRIDTTNPPGNELAAAKYVADVLQKENIAAEVIEVAPGRGVTVARLQAGPLPDSSRALLLVGHLDVVGVER